MISEITQSSNRPSSSSFSSDSREEKESLDTYYTENKTTTNKPSLKSDIGIKLEEAKSVISEQISDTVSVSGMSVTSTITTTRKKDSSISQSQAQVDIILESLDDKRFEIPECRIISSRYDPDGKYIAAACDDGVLRVYETKNWSLFTQFIIDENGEALLNLKWRPVSSTVKTKNVVICSDAMGNLYHIHVTTNQILHNLKEKDNQIYGIDYNFDATQFATGGTDCTVRVYDETKKSLSIELKGTESAPGHSNRILSVKYIGDNPYLLLSGAWDKTIQIWDTRMHFAIGYIYGPEIGGESMDLKGNILMTGSCRDKDQVQLWDFGTRKLMRTLIWDSNPKIVKNTFINSAQFSKTSDKYVIAGSSGSNQIKIFDIKNSDKLVKGYSLGNRGCYNVDFSIDDKRFLYSGEKGLMGVCDIKLVQNS